MSSFTFRTAPRIVAEIGGLARIGDLLAELGARRAIVVTDPGLAAAGVAGRCVAAAERVGAVNLFAEVEADPPVAMIRRAVAAARAFDADAVIGLGGGSSLDTAKLVALLARSDQPIEAIYGTDLAVGKRLPLIQVPTTAGTGSEVTWVSVVTNERNEKKAIYAPQLLPDVALLDAELTLGMPPRVTAATALDAMVHAIEAYTSRTRKNPVADAFAVKALELLSANLPRVLADGTDVEARAAMLQGALMGGMAFVNASVAAIHALAYPLGARFHIPHGHGNALVMAPVLRFNLPAAAALYAELASAILPGRRFAGEDEAAEAFVTAIAAMSGSGGLETRIGALGVGEGDIPGMAEEVVTGIQRLIALNPRDMAFDEVCAIYREIL